MRNSMFKKLLSLAVSFAIVLTSFTVILADNSAVDSSRIKEFVPASAVNGLGTAGGFAVFAQEFTNTSHMEGTIGVNNFIVGNNAFGITTNCQDSSMDGNYYHYFNTLSGDNQLILEHAYVAGTNDTTELDYTGDDFSIVFPVDTSFDDYNNGNGIRISYNDHTYIQVNQSSELTGMFPTSSSRIMTVEDLPQSKRINFDSAFAALDALAAVLSSDDAINLEPVKDGDTYTFTLQEGTNIINVPYNAIFGDEYVNIVGVDDNHPVIINIVDIPDGTSSLAFTTNTHLKFDGQTRQAGYAVKTPIMMNFAGFSGTITLGEDLRDGLILAPTATVSVGTTHHGNVIANSVSNPGGEIHHGQFSGSAAFVEPTDTPAPTDTDTPVPTETDTPVPTNTDTPVPTNTDTPVPTNTDTPVPTTVTDTPVPTNTDTPVPTNTDTPIPTNTDTPVPTNTDTPVPTNTDTPVPTNTDTPVPNTPTDIPYNTPTDIPNTPVPSVTISVSKVDIAGEEIPDAVIEITHNNAPAGEAPDASWSWISTDEAHNVVGLVPGETYTLHEDTAPAGYATVTDIEFTVDENGVITLVTVVAGEATVNSDGVLVVTDKPLNTDTPTPIPANSMTIGKVFGDGDAVADAVTFTVYRVNATGEELVGAFTKVAGQQTYEFTTNLTPGNYVIRESNPVDGYDLCDDIAISVANDGKITVTASDCVSALATSTDYSLVMKVINTPEFVPTNTDTPVPTNTDTPVPTTVTDTPVPTTVTDTPVPSNTNTPVPTEVGSIVVHVIDNDAIHSNVPVDTTVTINGVDYVTDQNGTVRVDNLPIGSNPTAVLTVPTGAVATNGITESPANALLVENSTDVPSYTFYIEHELGSIEVVVIDNDGLHDNVKVPNCTVTIDGVDYQTNDQGVITVENLPIGTNPTAVLTVPTGAVATNGITENPANSLLVENATDVPSYTFYIEHELGSIEVVVIDNDSLHDNVKVPNCTVTIDGVDYLTDENGVITVPNLPIGESHTAVLNVPQGVTPSASTTATVISNVVPGTHTFYIEHPVGTVVVIIYDEDGNFIPGATVDVNGDIMSTGPNGEIILTDMPMGDYVITIVDVPEGWEMPEDPSSLTSTVHLTPESTTVDYTREFEIPLKGDDEPDTTPVPTATATPAPTATPTPANSTSTTTTTVSTGEFVSIISIVGVLLMLIAVAIMVKVYRTFTKDL